MKHQISIRTALATGTAAVLVATTAAFGMSSASATPPAAPAKAAAPAAKPTKKQIAKLFDQWNAALLSGNAKKVADRYARDAVLLPTASPKIRTDRAGIVDYFEHFLQNKPKGKKIRTVIHVLDHNSALDAGLYRFTLTGKDGKKTNVDARYTYEYEKRGGKWLIVNHHSSVLPSAS